MLWQQLHFTPVFFFFFYRIDHPYQALFSEPECTKYTGWKIHRCLHKELSISGPPQVIIMQPGRSPSLRHTLSSRFDMSHGLQTVQLLQLRALTSWWSSGKCWTGDPRQIQLILTKEESSCLHQHLDFSPTIARAESANSHSSDPKR